LAWFTNRAPGGKARDVSKHDCCVWEEVSDGLGVVGNDAFFSVAFLFEKVLEALFSTKGFELVFRVTCFFFGKYLIAHVLWK
jgi:hypothetical protein